MAVVWTYIPPGAKNLLRIYLYRCFFLPVFSCRWSTNQSMEDDKRKPSIEVNKTKENSSQNDDVGANR